MVRNSIITIGGFDGVHVGHRALVRRANELADAWTARWEDRGAERPTVVAVVLDPSPAAILRPERAPARLTTFARRAELLRRAGAGMVVRIDVTEELLAMTPGGFLHAHIAPLNPAGIVEGPDFRFGNGRAGDVRTVVEYFKRADFVVATPEQVEVTLTDLSIVPARSSMVRWLLGQGRVRDAAVVLGRAHELEGKVVRGDQRGRGLGFPTANLETECMPPADGVYAGIATLPDGRRMGAAVSVGEKPTFAGTRRTVEAFLMDEGRRGGAWKPLEGIAEYGWKLRLELIGRVRDQQKFSGLGALVEQIERDCARIAVMVSEELRRTEPSEVAR